MSLNNLDWARLDTILKSGTRNELDIFLFENDLKIVDGKIHAQNQADLDGAIEYWDKRQLVKKINLNSLYGGLLNGGCRFFDKRLGQSTTLIGRQIAKHMAAKVNEIITGEYNHVGQSVIYGDTDSVYFSAYKSLKRDIENGQIPWDRNTVVTLYDQIASEVNGTFPGFMEQQFHCPQSRGEVIKAGREIVGEKALFITKKRYAVRYYDKEGKRADADSPGKIKVMGMDLKRSDTPAFIQDFLYEVLTMVLNGTGETETLEFISNFRAKLKSMHGWEKGSPKRVNNLTVYGNKEEKAGKANMPGHVRAALNWNTLKRMNSDKHSTSITDGAKVIVCKLKNNPLGFTSVAYPVDELRLPKWFMELPFDEAAMEAAIFDGKLENLIGVLGWDLRSTEEKNTFNQLFDFG